MQPVVVSGGMPSVRVAVFHSSPPFCDWLVDPRGRNAEVGIRIFTPGVETFQRICPIWAAHITIDSLWVM